MNELVPGLDYEETYSYDACKELAQAQSGWSVEDSILDRESRN